MEWATWGALLTRMALDKPGFFFFLNPLDTPLCLPHLGQLVGWTLLFPAQLCLLGPYSKTVLVCSDAQDPGVEGPAEPKVRSAYG